MEYKRSMSTPLLRRQVSALPFAGRIGGNQGFIDTDDSTDIVKRTPDANPICTIKDAFHWRGFCEPIIWKAAVIEAFATGLFVFINGLATNAIQGFASSTLAISFTSSITTWVSLSLFIYAAAPASGGHLNSFVTMSTLATGLATFPRAVIYIFGQLSGAVAGGYVLKLGLGGGDFFPQNVIGGCTIDTSRISHGQAYVLELGTYLTEIFLCFGVGLDPRQGQVFGPALSPMLVGLAVGVCAFGTGFVKDGWYGASLNPSRCFGLMAANQTLSNHWIHWLAAITAAIINGIFYHCIPPNPQYKRLQ